MSIPKMTNYSLKEIDQMRALTRELIAREESLSVYAIAPSNVEDRLRTYLSHYVSPEDLWHHVQGASEAEVLAGLHGLIGALEADLKTAREASDERLVADLSEELDALNRRRDALSPA